MNAAALLDLMQHLRPTNGADGDVARLNESFASSLHLEVSESARLAQARWLGLLRCRPMGDTGLLSVTYVAAQGARGAGISGKPDVRCRFGVWYGRHRLPPNFGQAQPAVQGPFVWDVRGAWRW